MEGKEEERRATTEVIIEVAINLLVTKSQIFQAKPVPYGGSVIYPRLPQMGTNMIPPPPPPPQYILVNKSINSNNINKMMTTLLK